MDTLSFFSDFFPYLFERLPFNSHKVTDDYGARSADPGDTVDESGRLIHEVEAGLKVTFEVLFRRIINRNLKNTYVWIILVPIFSLTKSSNAQYLRHFILNKPFFINSWLFTAKVDFRIYLRWGFKSKFSNCEFFVLELYVKTSLAYWKVFLDTCIYLCLT